MVQSDEHHDPILMVIGTTCRRFWYRARVFSWPTTLVVAQKRMSKVLKQKATKQPKSVFFFRWASSISCESIMMVFTWCGNIYSEQYRPHHFLTTFDIPQTTSNTALNNYDFIHMCNEHNHYSRLALIPRSSHPSIILSLSVLMWGKILYSDHVQQCTWMLLSEHVEERHIPRKATS